MAETEEIHHFDVSATWSGDALGSGTVALPDGQSVAIAGPTSLGGVGGKASPEELLLSALAACFLNTWSIFLKKLGLAYAEPSLRASGELGKDPAGGYKFRKAVVHVRVPAPLYEAQRAQVEKTLSLTEKYCIISKVVRSAMPLEVVVEEI